MYQLFLLGLFFLNFTRVISVFSIKIQKDTIARLFSSVSSFFRNVSHMAICVHYKCALKTPVMKRVKEDREDDGVHSLYELY